LDHRRARPGRLILVALAAVGASAAAQEPLRAQRWLAPGPAALASLTRVPAERLARPVNPEAALSVEVGRAAFRTPVLLGGQAARAGLSCEACHRGGRSNPQFLFPGISGAPGTADVTSSLFSSHRGDGVFDPKPIPDLSGPKSVLKIDQSARTRALEGFIHGLVTQEFDGPEPAPSILAGLAAYVRALEPADRPAAPDQPLTAGLYLDDARRAVRAALSLADRGDATGAELMVAAARARLGLIHERFAGPGLAAERERLRRADHALAAIAEALREGRPVQAPLRRWLGDSTSLERALSRREAASLFNPARLAASASPLPPQSR
jgi:hypothetical protein